MSRPLRGLTIALLGLAPLLATAQSATPPDNPNIDMTGFLRVANEAAKSRPSRRLTESDFLKASREKGTIVLDARSREKYDELHIRGAVNLTFPDITAESLARLIPDRSARILIYCNNNFRNAEGPFPSKLPSASLNLSTWIALTNYGYRNVWELGPYIDIGKSALPFDGRSSEGGKAQLAPPQRTVLN